MVGELEWTGERMVKNDHLAVGIVEHLHRYAICKEYTQGKVVLDIACGEGYGSNLISQNAKHVTGIDISEQAVQFASKKYVKDNLKFLQGSVLAIPLESSSIDVVVSFETLEHLVEQEQMLKEFKRILKPEGILIISTPEKENYSSVDPNNPYHLRELTGPEFKGLLSEEFKFVNISNQKFTFSSVIINQNNKDQLVEYYGTFEKIEKRNFIGSHIFNLAICSDIDIAEFNNSIFNGKEFFDKMVESLQKAYYADTHKIAQSAKEEIYATKVYKIGKFATMPYRIIKNIFS